MNVSVNLWDDIREYEIDATWREALSERYLEYRRNFELAQKRAYAGTFPLSLEVEATYYCNLSCPFCPRVAGLGEREDKHMPSDTWRRIIEEAKANGLPAILMDHEAESLMNKNFFSMLADARNAGVIDIWLHSNGNILTPRISEKLIDGGITKMNFSIDAVTPQTYEKVRVGGDYSRVIRNIDRFLAVKQEKNARHLRVRVSFVITKDNEHEKKDFFDFWKKKPGVNMITFQKCEDFSVFERPDGEEHLSVEELDAKYADAEPFHCSMPWEMPVIDVEGNVLPCGAPVRRHNADFVLGNLNRGDTIRSCWNGDKMKALRALHDSGKWHRNSMCRVCVKQRRAIGEQI